MKDRNEERPRDQATVAIKAPYLRAQLAVTASGGRTELAQSERRCELFHAQAPSWASDAGRP
jgi:hypothetical protein